MMQYCFQKTEKGREEITTRKYGLSLRLRSILLLMNGKKSIGDLARTYPGLGLTETLLLNLEGQGFITIASSANLAATQDSEGDAPNSHTVVHTEADKVMPATHAPAPSLAPSPASLFLHTLLTIDENLVTDSVVEESSLTAQDSQPKRPTLTKPLEEHPTLFEAIKDCYVHGLGNFPPAAAAPLLRSLNNAQTIKALAELRPAYLHALRTIEGSQAASQSEQELELLLLAGEV